MGGFVKVIKNRSYFKRYQVKFRRRREGVTDYYSRRKLITQDKNKYNAKKHRFIVRISNKNVVCQIAYATLTGDVTVCHAESKELTRYGIKVGLTNYAAAYCTGLLCARRLLQKYKLDSKFAGMTNEDAVGDDYMEEGDPEGPGAFYAVLDIGLARSSTGARVFGAMKGALDGGIEIPHSETRFPGYNHKEKSFSAELHRDRIFGLHVVSYMKKLKEKDDGSFERQFSDYVKNGLGPDNLEQTYKNAHSAIRKDPSYAPKKPHSSVQKKKSAKEAASKVSKRKLKSIQRMEVFRRKKLRQAEKAEFLKDIGVSTQ